MRLLTNNGLKLNTTSVKDVLGAPWHDLPEHYVNWKSVFTRFSRLSETNLFEATFEYLNGEPTLTSFILIPLLSMSTSILTVN